MFQTGVLAVHIKKCKNLRIIDAAPKGKLSQTPPNHNITDCALWYSINLKNISA